MWYFLDFADSWRSRNTTYRCIYTKPISDKEGQILLDFNRPESILYTNLGMDNDMNLKLMETNNIPRIKLQVIIVSYHSRARNELVNRAFKDFGTEQLPFKRFAANSAFYYLMTIEFFLFEAFKSDKDSKTIPIICIQQPLDKIFSVLSKV